MLYVLWLLGVWLLLTGELSMGNVLLGLLLAGLVLMVLPGRQLTMASLRQWSGRRLLHALALIGYFLWELVVSALTVARAVVRPRMELRPGIVAIPLKDKSPAAVLTLANLITMTPGTLSLYADEQTQILYAHGMNVTNPDEFRRTVQRSFARRVEEVMG